MRILLLAVGLWLSVFNAFGQGIAVRAANNGTDFANRRITASNLGISQMSPAGGNNIYTDMLTNTSTYDGQFGTSYSAGGGRNGVALWNANGVGTGTNVWGTILDFPGSFGHIGSAAGGFNAPIISAPPNSVQNMNFDFNCNPYASTKFAGTNGNAAQLSSDSGMYINQFNPYASCAFLYLSQASTNASLGWALRGTNTDGQKIYLSPFSAGFGLVQVGPDEVSPLNNPHSADIILGAGLPFFLTENVSFDGDTGNQHFYFGTDSRGAGDSSKTLGIHFPVWKANVVNYTNTTNIDALFIDERNGNISTVGTNYSKSLNVTNTMWLNPEGFLPANQDAAFQVGTNALFACTDAAWAFDGGIVNHAARMGFVAKSGQYPMLVHASGAPFQIARSSAANLVTTGVASQTLTPELTFDGTTGDATFAVNLSVPKTISSTTGNQNIAKMSGSVIFAASAQTITLTDSLVTTNSVIMATVAFDDTTAKSCIAVANSGTVTLKLNAAATAATRVNFLITN